MKHKDFGEFMAGERKVAEARVSRWAESVVSDGSSTVDKALRILFYLAETGEPTKLSECARDLAMHKATIHRCLRTLTGFGLAWQDPETGRYLLGAGVLDLSHAYNQQTGFVDVATHHLVQLATDTGETVNLVVMDDGMCLYLVCIEGSHSVRMVARQGSRDLMHCTSVGKAILAHLAADVVEDIVQTRGLPSRTPHTITDLQELSRQLVDIRRWGFSLDRMENEDGSCCVGAPIFDTRGRPVAAISVAGPAFRLTERRLMELGPKVRATANTITQDLERRGTTIPARL